MPITCTIDHERRRVSATAEGTVTFDEIARHLDEQERLGTIRYARLLDVGDAVADLSAEQVARLARREDTSARGRALGVTAIVGARDVTFGVARMYQILASDSGARVGVFRTCVEAEVWLAAQERARGAEPSR